MAGRRTRVRAGLHPAGLGDVADDTLGLAPADIANRMVSVLPLLLATLVIAVFPHSVQGGLAGASAKARLGAGRPHRIGLGRRGTALCSPVGRRSREG